jgi:hypothetical protein
VLALSVATGLAAVLTRTLPSSSAPPATRRPRRPAAALRCSSATGAAAREPHHHADAFALGGLAVIAAVLGSATLMAAFGSARSPARCPHRHPLRGEPERLTAYGAARSGRARLAAAAPTYPLTLAASRSPGSRTPRSSPPRSPPAGSYAPAGGAGAGVRLDGRAEGRGRVGGRGGRGLRRRAAGRGCCSPPRPP